MTEEKKVKFEKGLEELEKIVRAMESGDLSLEDVLKHYEGAVPSPVAKRTIMNTTVWSAVNPDRTSPIAASRNAAMEIRLRSSPCMWSAIVRAITAPPRKWIEAAQPAWNSVSADSSVSTPIMAGSTSSDIKAIEPSAE